MIVNKKTFTVSSQYHIDHRSAEIVIMFHFSQEVKLLHYIDVNCNEYEFKTFYLQWLNMNISFVKNKFDDMGDLPDDSMNGVNNFKTGPMDCGKKVSKCVDFVVLYRYIGYKIGQILYLLCIKFDFILNLKDLLEKKIYLARSKRSSCGTFVQILKFFLQEIWRGFWNRVHFWIGIVQNDQNSQPFETNCLSMKCYLR